MKKLLMKVKDYSRSRKLDGEAKKGRQAVDLNALDQPPTSWGDGEEHQEDDADTLNAVGTKCYSCGKKGTLHPIAQRGRAKARVKGRGKERVRTDRRGKGRAKEPMVVARYAETRTIGRMNAPRVPRKVPARH